MKKTLFSFLFLFCLINTNLAQILDHSWSAIVNQKNEQWFGSDEAIAIAENVLLYQRDIGGWTKNTRMQDPLPEEDKLELLEVKSSPKGCTIDNGATFLEMKYLSRMYGQVRDERYKEAFLKGLDYLLKAQYENGGWPQFYPLRQGYYSHITYNDNAMEHALEIMRDIAADNGDLSISADSVTRQRCKDAFEKGIQCILETQYKQNGVLTAWCAQHDASTLEPAKARTYELPSLSGKESAKLVLLLMSIENPSVEVKQAIEAAVAWFEKTKITGIRQESYHTEDGLREKRLVADSDAEPLWGRFMELNDNTPFFCDRDGVKKYSMMEIGRERRNGYAWYTDEPRKVLKKYPKWKKKNQ